MGRLSDLYNDLSQQQAEAESQYIRTTTPGLRMPSPKPEPVQREQEEEPGLLSDAWSSFGIGAGQLVKGAEWLFGTDTNIGQDTVDYWQGQLSDAQVEANEQRFVDEDMSLGEGFSNPRTWMGTIVQSLPMMVPGIGAAGGVAKLGIRAGMSKAGATAAGAAAGSSMEGATIGALVGEEVEQVILNAPIEELRNSPYFQDLVDAGKSEDEARRMVAEKTSDEAALKSGIPGALLGIAFNKFVGDAVTGRLSERLLKETGKGVAEGAGTEAAQTGVESYAKQTALNENLGRPYNLSEAANEIVGGTGAGGVMGGAVGFGGGLAGSNTPEQPAATGEDPPAPQPAMDPEAEQAVQPEHPTDPDEPAFDDGLDNIGQRMTEAENAPVSIRNRGRNLAAAPEAPRPLSEQVGTDVNAEGPQIVYQQDGITVEQEDNQFRAYNEDGLEAFGKDAADARRKLTRQIERNWPKGPILQNRDRNTPAYIAQMREIAQNPKYNRVSTSREPTTGAPMAFPRGVAPEVPAMNLGRKDTVTMSDGKGGEREVPVQYAVVEADDVQASHRADGKENKGYTADGLIALNNGRTAGLQAAYEQGNADPYLEAMLADDMHGIDPAAIRTKQRPMLIRLFDGQSLEGIDNPGDASNTSPMADLSLSEQAKTDAGKLDNAILSEIQPGDPTGSGNSDFVTRAVDAIGKGDTDTIMRDREGLLTSAGQRRIRGALIARAYSDDTLTQELVEATDSDLKTLGDALTEVAGRWALMREQARQNAINPDMDVTDALVSAVNMIRKSRQEGRSLKDIAGQIDAFAGETDRMAVYMLSLFYRGASFNRIRSKDAIAGALSNYIETALQSSPGVDMFGEQTQPQEVLSREAEQAEGPTGAEAAQSTRRVRPDGPDNRDAGAEGERPRRDSGRTENAESGESVSAAGETENLTPDLAVETEQPNEQVESEQADNLPTQDGDQARTDTEADSEGNAEAARSDEPEGERKDALDKKQQGRLPEGYILKRQTKGPFKGRWRVVGIDGFMGSIRKQQSEAVDSALEKIEATEASAKAAEAERKAQNAVAEKIRAGNKPTQGDWKAAGLADDYQLDRGYVYQSDVSPFLVEYFDLPKNNIRKNLGKAAGILRSDMGNETPIVYLDRLHEVFGPAEPKAESKPEPKRENTVTAQGVTVRIPTIDQQLIDDFNRNTYIASKRDLNQELRDTAESLLNELAERPNTLVTDEQKAKAKELVESYIEKMAEFDRWDASFNARNPSWIVTGRSNRNMEKANRKNEKHMDEYSRRFGKLDAQRKRIFETLYGMRPESVKNDQAVKADQRRITQLVADIAMYMSDGRQVMEKETRKWASPKAHKTIEKALERDREATIGYLQEIEASETVVNLGGLAKILGPRSKAGKLVSELLGDSVESRRSSYRPNPGQNDLFADTDALQQLELDDAYDNLETRPGTTQAQRRAGRSALRDFFRQLNARLDRQGQLPADGGGISLLGAAIYKNFKEGRPNQLIGQTVRTPRDLAALAQVYRDPRFETFRFILTRNGEVVSEQAITSRLPAAVSFQNIDATIADLKQSMADFEADGYYMLHNHPSGKSSPSAADFAFTDKIAGEVPGYIQHVVIDTNEYSVIGKKDEGFETIQDETLGSTDFWGDPELPHDVLGAKIDGPKALGEIAKTLQQPDRAVFVSTTARGEVALVTSFPGKTVRSMMQRTASSKRRSEMAAMIRRMRRASGSGGYGFLVVNDEAEAKALKNLMGSGVVRDIVTPDGFSLASVEMRGFSQDLMETLPKKTMRVADRQAGYRRTPETRTEALTAQQARTYANTLMRDWKDRPAVTVADSISDFPKPLREAIRLAGAEGDMRAVFWNQEVYILAPRIPNRQALEEVILHEVVGHYGLRKMVGGELKPLLDRVYRDMKDTPKAKEIISIYFGNQFDPKKSEHRLTVAEELLAHLAESGKQRHRTLWQRIVAAVRDGLRRLGFTLKMTDTDLLNILAGAQKTVEEGGFSRPSEADSYFRRAYHGTPHRFDKFSLEAIGTGEGAQAYGWGLYFAGNREVADFYRKVLQESQVTVNGVTIPNQTGGAISRDALAATIKEKTGASQRQAEQLTRIFNVGDKQLSTESVKAEFEQRVSDYRNGGFNDAANQMEALRPFVEKLSVSQKDTGNLYEVEIPDDSDLLDYNNRLNDQPEGITEAVRAVTDEQHGEGTFDAWMEANEEGGDYREWRDNLMEEVEDRELSMRLNEKGVPGLRYLDADSRIGAADGGTHNYVIWDESVVSVQAVNDEIAQAEAYFSRSGQKQTDTEAFRKWFGDSVITDDNDAPMVMYHGSRHGKFDAFQPSMHDENALYGISFSPDPKVAERYANNEERQRDLSTEIQPQVYSVYIQSDRLPDTMTFINEVESHFKTDDYTSIPWDDVVAWARDQGIRALDASDIGVPDEIFVIDPTAIKSADNAGTFDPANPDIRFSRAGNRLDAAATHFNDLTDSQRAALGKIAPRTPRERAQDWLRERTDRWQTKVRQGAVDRFAALADVDMAVHGRDVVENSTASSSWVLAQMSGSAAGALQSMLTTARVKLNQREKVITTQDGTRGLNDTLKQLGSAAEIERFFGWIAGNRSKRLMAEGRENLFEPQEVEALASLNRGTTDSGQSRLTLYDQVFREFQQYRDDVLSIAEQSGIITLEQRETWANEFYVPFYRLAEDDGSFTGPKATGGISRQEAYKKLKGGTRPLNDLLENTMMNFHHLLQASLKNQAAMQAMDNSQEMGIAREVREADRDTENSTFILRDGQKVWYEIDDPLVFKAVTALAHPGMNSTAMKVMRSFKRLFTNLTTTTPQFVIANLLRDSMQAAATSEVSKNILKNMAQGSKVYGDPKIRAKMLASGGSFSFGHLYGENADELRLRITGGLAQADILRSPSMIPNAISGMWRKWNEMTEFTENINRAAIFEQNQDRGELYAAFKARDLMNFSQHGAWPAMRVLIDVVPFLNARLQGLDKIYRSGVKPGLRTAMGQGTANEKQAAMRFWSVTGTLALATIALYLNNRDDEEYQKLEEWQKDTYWFFRLSDDHAIFIPKPFEVGAIATLAERLTEQAVSDTATGKLFADRLSHMLLDTFSFSPVPQMFQPALDIYSNYDAFTGRPIESMGMERLSPSLRRRNNTTSLATGLSAATESVFGANGRMTLSPVQIDHAIQGYFGSVGAWVAGIADTVWRTANGETAPSTFWYENQPVRRFYKNLGDEDRYTRYGTVFYEALKETNRVYADIKEYIELGDTESARALYRENRNKLAYRIILNRVQRKLSEVNNAMQKVRRLEASPEYKRRELDRLRALKNRMQEVVSKRIEQINASDS